MLRGRRSCAISDRPTPSSAPKNPLSPIIPVHTRRPPVSPIIPVHTQKQGDGGTESVRISFALTVAAVPVSNTGDSNRLVQERTTSEGVPYTSCRSVPQKPRFYRELFKNVGAPTFLILHANKKKQCPPASAGGLYKNPAPLLSFFSALLLATSHSLARRRRATKSNYSRTYGPFARKSNHSRTYANQGEGVPHALAYNPFVFF